MFIGRRLDNSIYGAWSTRQHDDADHPRMEEVPDTHPDLVAFLTPKPSIDFSDVNNIEKGLKALALCVAQIGGLTVPQLKTLFKQKWDSLP
jgi:hypothetical protein